LTLRDKYREKIEQGILSVVERRQIDCVLHFTPLELLPLILAFGIRTRRELMHAGAVIGSRLDGEDDAVSVSVTCYRPELFDAKRHKSGNKAWLILGLSPDVLWRYRCRFYGQGVPTSSTKYENHNRYGDWALEKLFDDYPVGFRAKHGLPPSFPTRADAEVQVLSAISPDYITGAWVETSEHERAVRYVFDAAGRRECEVFVRPFKPRIASGFYAWG
jgi:hypothetical protein|tara:strand:- start:945 stop:1598 length:654 start_codon:yes stop_codon:yes gene_type:complete